MLTHVIFDLDGTLIDSAASILEGMQVTLEAAGIVPRLPIVPGLIGPPLRTTLTRLAGEVDPAVLDGMVAHFIRWYDAEGYRRTRVYPGIPELLQTLHAAGWRLHIVTNKRLHPTRLILAWLGWSPLFESVDTQDAQPDAPLAHKSEVLARLLGQLGAGPEQAVYVGDRRDDFEAAAANGLRCHLVSWGYGAADARPEGSVLFSTPGELAEALCAARGASA